MKNDGFSLFSRLPSFGWEVLHPPPKVMCEDMHNQYLRSRAQLGGWPNSLETRENSIMVRHHGRASSARSRKVSCGHGYLPRAGKRVAAAQRKGPDFLNHIRGSSHDKCQVTSVFHVVPYARLSGRPSHSGPVRCGVWSGSSFAWPGFGSSAGSSTLLGVELEAWLSGATSRRTESGFRSKTP